MEETASTMAWDDDVISRRWMDALSSALDAGVLLVSAETELEFASAAALDLLGASTMADLVADWPRMVQRMEGIRALLASQRGRLDVDIAVNGSTRTVRWELFPPHDAGPCVVFLRDADEARRTEAQSVLATKFLCYSRLHRAAAHELRDPLNTIALNLAVLRMEAGSPGAMDEGLAALERTFQGFCSSFQTFLRLSQIPENNSCRFEFGELVTEMGALLTPLARQQGVTLRIHKPHDAVRFTGRRERLREALVLAVVQAIDVVPSGGELDLSLESTGKHVRICISGAIEGVLSETGTAGLDLRLARAAVEEHAGSMRIDRRKPRGAALTIDLPVYSDSAAPRAG
jgi:signal transduction histidine kinase